MFDNDFVARIMVGICVLALGAAVGLGTLLGHLFF